MTGGVVLLVAVYSGVALLWLAWRWDRPVRHAPKRPARRRV